MTQEVHPSPSPGLYDQMLAAERIGADLVRELEIRAPEAMLRKALESRSSTIRAILSDWIQQQEDLLSTLTYPPEAHIKKELRRRLKMRLIRCFPDHCNF